MVIGGRFRDLPGAEMASTTLDAAALDYELADTYTIGLVWTYSTALGWIRLSVADSDSEVAREVLEPAEEVDWPAEFESDEEIDHCPICNSADLEVVSGARKTLALMLITMGLPLWFWRSRLRCRACGWSRVIPIRIRPEIVGAWLIAAAGACVLTAVVFIAAGYVIRSRV